MDFFFETTRELRSQGKSKSVVFSWTSFYLGVVVALGMMLVAHKVVPNGALVGTHTRAQAVCPQ